MAVCIAPLDNQSDQTASQSFLFSIFGLRNVIIFLYDLQNLFPGRFADVLSLPVHYFRNCGNRYPRKPCNLLNVHTQPWPFQSYCRSVLHNKIISLPVNYFNISILLKYFPTFVTIYPWLRKYFRSFFLS